MNMPEDFLDAVRDGDWSAVARLVDAYKFDHAICVPAKSVFAWLIDLNAPAFILEACIRSSEMDSEDLDRMGLLDLCLKGSSTKSNNFETFCLLLGLGVSPNAIAEGGSTLLQKAMELNKLAEVEQLLNFGVDPQQTSIFGRESTTNIEEASLSETAAARLAFKRFLENDKFN